MKFFQKSYLIIVIFICLLGAGCIKTNTPPGTSALTIVNAIPNSNALVTNFWGNTGSQIAMSDTLQYYATALQIYYANWSELSSYSGKTSLSLPQISDTTTSLTNLTMNLQIGSIYSLFITGSDTAHVDTLFTKDIIPYYPYSGDSVIGVRFINLSTGSLPVQVTLQSDTTHTPIANNISYKTVTPFQELSSNVNALANGYTFEFRDAASDSVLTTVSFTTGSYPAMFPFKSVTICLIGQPGVSAAVPLSGMIYPNY